MRNFFNRATGLEKLIQIVRESWNHLAENIASGKICINNEADLELELGYLLKKKGLYVGRQHPASLNKSTSKTASGNAKVDLYTTLSDRQGNYTAAIEMKWPHDHMPKDYRIEILNDIENLEAYIKDGIADVGFALVYTKERSYLDDNHEVKINSTGHQTDWLTFNDEQECFLTILVN
ncbi:MAG: hypothetical protein J5730_03530 [Bacteroidales bacterium]|nr:hypothetical protein [Bacteroidales bacterium]